MMTPDRPTRITDEQRERLSAYLDGMLSSAERQSVETQLRQDPDLQRELNSLKATRDLLRSLPELRAPRDLRLTPAMVSARPARIHRFPISAALSAAAAFILIMAGILSLPPRPSLTTSTTSDPQSISALMTAVEATTQPALPTATATTARAIQATTTSGLMEDTITTQAMESAPAEIFSDQMQTFGLADAQLEALAEITAPPASAASDLAAGIAPIPGSDASRTTGGNAAEPAGALPSLLQATAESQAVAPPVVMLARPTLARPTATAVPTNTPTLIPTDTPPTVQPTMTLANDGTALETNAIASESASSSPTASIILIAAGIALSILAGIFLLRSRR